MMTDTFKSITFFWCFIALYKTYLLSLGEHAKYKQVFSYYIRYKIFLKFSTSLRLISLNTGETGSDLNAWWRTSLKPIYFWCQKECWLCVHQVVSIKSSLKVLMVGGWLCPLLGVVRGGNPAPSGKILEWIVVVIVLGVWISFLLLWWQGLSHVWVTRSHVAQIQPRSFSGIGMQTLGETHFPAAVTNLEICLSGWIKVIPPKMVS